LPRLIGTPNGI